MIDVDVHTHLAPINAARLATLPGVQWKAEDEALVLDGHRVGIKDLFHPERLIAWMDRHAVRRALVSIPPPLYRQQLPADEAAQWVSYVNDELLAITQASQGRLGALRYVPLEHPSLVQAAVDALRQSPANKSFEGVALAAGGHPDIAFDAPTLAPLWQVLNEQSAFVFIHPGTCADPRLARYYLENLLGNPYETGVAAAHLVLAGVPARYPQMRLCLAHAGGVFPSICGRLQRGFDTARPGLDLQHERPLQAARRFYADGIAHHGANLQLAREVFGADHVLFGSDWPFPMGIPSPDSGPAGGSA